MDISIQEQLESRLAYTEYTLEQLNAEVTQQQREIQQLRRQLQQLVERMHNVSPQLVAPLQEETPPPHY
jgi:SlyX protein